MNFLLDSIGGGDNNGDDDDDGDGWDDDFGDLIGKKVKIKLEFFS